MNKCTGDFRLAVAEGNTFFEAACWCEGKNLDLDMVSPYLFPFAVNMTFAIEVYMKAIMIYYSPGKESVRGHYLDDLFQQLPQDVRNRIEIDFHKSKIIHDLNFTLTRHRDAFQVWRYAFENTGKDLEIHSSDIGRLANCLKDYCNGLLMDDYLVEKGTNSDL